MMPNFLLKMTVCHNGKMDILMEQILGMIYDDQRYTIMIDDEIAGIIAIQFTSEPNHLSLIGEPLASW